MHASKYVIELNKLILNFYVIEPLKHREGGGLIYHVISFLCQKI